MTTSSATIPSTGRGAGKPRIAVGIPSYQEASNIERITGLIDRAAGRCSYDAQFVLVNMDNRSADGTATRFSATPTTLTKVSLTTPEGVVGKGANLRVLFAYAVELGYDAAISLDADLELVDPSWLSTYASQVIDEGAGMVVPVYARLWYDANQTNQVSAPLVLGVTGIPIRQPIGGDYAFSANFMRARLNESWPEAATRFGTDAYLVLTAARAGVLSQATLVGGKHHSWRSDTPEQIEEEFPLKFGEQVATMLQLLAAWPASDPASLPPFPAAPPLLPGMERNYDLGLMPATAWAAWERVGHDPLFAELAGGAASVLPGPDDDAWAAVLVRMFRRAQINAIDYATMEAFRALFFARVAWVQPRLRGLSQSEIDDTVWSLAGAVRHRLDATSTA